MRRRRILIAILLTISVGLCTTPPASGGAPLAPPPVSPGAPSPGSWRSPTVRVVIEAPYQAPADPYAAGHRGIDLAAKVGSSVRAPAAGIVAFSGPVAGRGVITIDHGGGLVSTLEPVARAAPAGTAVEAGEAVAAVATGGHAVAGTVHFGVRLHGAYVNPLLLIGDAPRAVLLPLTNDQSPGTG